MAHYFYPLRREQFPRSCVCLVLLCAMGVQAANLSLPVTNVRDVLYGPADGIFNGTVTITPSGFGNATRPPILSVPVHEGMFSVQLLPSTSEGPSACYKVAYLSASQETWAETWVIPAGKTALALKDVRSVQKTLSESSLPSAELLEARAAPVITLPIRITDVTGLTAQLSSINQSINTLTGTVNALSAQPSASSSPILVRGEVPSGAANGSNVNFTLAAPPIPGTLVVYRNGMRLSQNADYSIAGSNISFINGTIPKSSDIIVADYDKVRGS